MTKTHEKPSNGSHHTTASIANAILAANGAPQGASTTHPTTPAPSTSATTSKPMINDFVRSAIREKAERELGAVRQRIDAFGGIERTRDALHTMATDLTSATAAFSSLPSTDNTGATKLKKLRKLVDDAHALATELSDTLGVDRERDSLQAQKRDIEKALESAGINPRELDPS